MESLGDDSIGVTTYKAVLQLQSTNILYMVESLALSYVIGVSYNWKLSDVRRRFTQEIVL